MSDTKHPTIADASVESILAEKCLDETLKAPGDLCAYAALAKATSRDPQNGGYPYVVTARRRFERKHNCTLAAEWNVGIRWLTPEAVAIQKYDQDISHHRRHIKSTLRRQKTLLDERADQMLTPETRKKRDANLAYAGALVLFAKPKYERRVSEAVMNSEQRIATEATIKFFQKEEA